MSIPRKHHYVPQFYLTGFAVEPPKLFVLDKEAGRSYQSRIGDTGCERDFYIIEVEDEGDPFAVEKFFSAIEGAGAEALRFITEHRAIPEGELYGKFVAFVAVMAVRGPAVRDAIEKPFAQVMKSILWQLTASPEVFARMMEKLKTEGKDVVGFNYESMRDFVRSDDCVVTMGQNFRMNMLLEMVKEAEPLVAARKWTVMVAGEGAPDFICSDRPLTLSWTKADLALSHYSPGLGLKGTTAMFPVSRRVALLGVFEGNRAAHELNSHGVGTINMFTAMHAKRLIYSGTDDFTVSMGEAGGLAGRAEFMDRVKGTRDADGR